MVIRLALILFLALPAFGQFKAFYASDQPFLGNAVAVGGVTPPSTNGFVDTYYPTNITGYPANGWWVANNANADGCTNTTGQVTNWLDYSGSGYHLTNNGAIATPYLSNNWLNGRSIIAYPGVATYCVLRNLGYTNDTAAWGGGGGMEFVCLVYGDWEDATGTDIISSGNETSPFRRQATTGAYQFSVFTSGGAFPTNKWVVADMVILANTGRCYGYTNGVLIDNSPAGAATYNGIAIGGRGSDGHITGRIRIAEIVSYHTNLTDAIRSNLFNYMTNKYFLKPTDL